MVSLVLPKCWGFTGTKWPHALGDGTGHEFRCILSVFTAGIAPKGTFVCLKGPLLKPLLSLGNFRRSI